MNVIFEIDNDTLIQAAREALARPRDFGYFGDLNLFEVWGLTVADNRDSDLMTKSNFRSMVRDLEALLVEHGEEASDYMETVHCGHWLVGWMDHRRGQHGAHRARRKRLLASTRPGRYQAPGTAVQLARTGDGAARTEVRADAVSGRSTQGKEPTMFSITADGKSFDDDSSHDGLCNVTVTPLKGELEYRCRNCSEALERYIDTERPWHSAERKSAADECHDADPDTFDDEASRFGPHVPVPVPLFWLDSAEIDIDTGADQVTLSLMINGSPVALTVHRVNQEGHENHDQLVLRVPHADDDAPIRLHEINRGAYTLELR